MKKNNLLFSLVVVFIFVISGNMIYAFEFDYEKYDFSGETVYIVHFNDVFDEDKAEPELLERREMAEEKFNANIESKRIKWGDYVETCMSRLLAGDSENDIWYLASDFYWPLLGQGALFPIGDVVPNEYFEDFKGPLEPITYKGQIYGIADTLPSPLAMFYIIWNKDLFEREGLPNLYEIYEAGDWDWDKFTEIALEATRDTNGDGSMNQFGYTGFFEYFFYTLSNDAPMVIEDEGRLISNVTSPEHMEALEQMREWIVDYEMSKPRRDVEAFFDGNVAMILSNAYPLGNFQDKMKDDFGVVPLPLGPSAEAHRYPMRGIGSYYIPTNANKPEGLTALYNYIFEDLYTAEEERKELEDRVGEGVSDEKAFEIILNAKEKWDGEAAVYRGFRRGFVGEDYRTTFHHAISREDETPATLMEEIDQVLQSELDDLFDQ